MDHPPGVAAAEPRHSSDGVPPHLAAHGPRFPHAQLHDL